MVWKKQTREQGGILASRVAPDFTGVYSVAGRCRDQEWQAFYSTSAVRWGVGPLHNHVGGTS
jgi:hypothetical protein